MTTTSPVDWSAPFLGEGGEAASPRPSPAPCCRSALFVAILSEPLPPPWRGWTA